jgi:hypothetical protein
MRFTSAVMVALHTKARRLGEGSARETLCPGQSRAKLRQFLALWGKRGVKGGVGEPDYAAFFDKAIAIIDETCDNFTPPS